MKIFIIAIGTMFLVACGGGGGSDSGSGSPPVHGKAPDTTPHDYAVGIFQGSSSAGSATFSTVCDFGLVTAESHLGVNVVVTPPATSGYTTGGCGGMAHSLTVDVVNTGISTIYFEVNIDSVWHPELETMLLPGQTHTFQRGF